MVQKVFIILASAVLVTPAVVQAAASTTPTASTIYSLVGTSTPAESSVVIEKEIRLFSPKAAAFAAPILAGIDAARIGVAGFLQGQIVQTAPQLPGNAFLIPSNTNSLSQTNQFDWHRVLTTIIGVLWTLYFYVLIILRFLIAKALICYSFIVIAFFYILYRLWRYIARPHWRKRNY